MGWGGRTADRIAGRNSGPGSSIGNGQPGALEARQADLQVGSPIAQGVTALRASMHKYCWLAAIQFPNRWQLGLYAIKGDHNDGLMAMLTTRYC
jgi:hypothetical protein